MYLKSESSTKSERLALAISNDNAEGVISLFNSAKDSRERKELANSVNNFTGEPLLFLLVCKQNSPSKERMLEEFRKAGVNWNIKNERTGVDLFHIMAMRGRADSYLDENLELIQRLLRNGHNPQPDKYGNLPSVRAENAENKGLSAFLYVFETKSKNHSPIPPEVRHAQNRAATRVIGRTGTGKSGAGQAKKGT